MNKDEIIKVNSHYLELIEEELVKVHDEIQSLQKKVELLHNQRHAITNLITTLSEKTTASKTEEHPTEITSNIKSSPHTDETDNLKSTEKKEKSNGDTASSLPLSLIDEKNEDEASESLLSSNLHKVNKETKDDSILTTLRADKQKSQLNEQHFFRKRISNKSL